MTVLSATTYITARVQGRVQDVLQESAGAHYTNIYLCILDSAEDGIMHLMIPSDAELVLKIAHHIGDTVVFIIDGIQLGAELRWSIAAIGEQDA